MAPVAGLLGLVVLAGYVWIVHRKTAATAERLERLNDRLFAWGNESRKAIESLDGRLAVLEFESKRQAGQIRITPDMFISEILSIHPRMEEVLAGLHLGGCGSCRISTTETLSEAADSYHLDITEILGEIERFLEDPASYQPNPKATHGSGDALQIRVPEGVDR